MPEVPMNQVVMVPIPLSPEAAERLGEDEARREAIGRMVSRLVAAEAGAPDPIEALLNALPRDPDAPEMTMEEVQAEIDAARAEHRR
jgi:hypothetical protein